LTTVPGGKPVTAEPGATPKAPVSLSVTAALAALNAWLFNLSPVSSSVWKLSLLHF